MTITITFGLWILHKFRKHFPFLTVFMLNMSTGKFNVVYTVAPYKPISSQLL